jgi:hypothetical protein
LQKTKGNTKGLPGTERETRRFKREHTGISINGKETQRYEKKQKVKTRRKTKGLVETERDTKE